jgi:polyphosphate kinase 2 (PPK2 family)
VRERSYWNDYMDAYEVAIGETATPESPWYVVPADNKWFTRIVVAAAIIQTLDSLGLKYPRLGKAHLLELKKARGMLMKEKG